jgi:hypothetical protein
VGTVATRKTGRRCWQPVFHKCNRHNDLQSGRPDSNRRRPAWEAGILPTELRPRAPPPTHFTGPATYAISRCADNSGSARPSSPAHHAPISQRVDTKKPPHGGAASGKAKDSKSHWSDLNRRPLDYESSALPLSYSGVEQDEHEDLRRKCPGADSNRDALRHHPLKMACLPVSPPGRYEPQNNNGADGARTRDLSSDSRVL